MLVSCVFNPKVLWQFKTGWGCERKPCVRVALLTRLVLVKLLHEKHVETQAVDIADVMWKACQTYSECKLLEGPQSSLFS